MSGLYGMMWYDHWSVPIAAERPFFPRSRFRVLRLVRAVSARKMEWSYDGKLEVGREPRYARVPVFNRRG